MSNSITFYIKSDISHKSSMPEMRGKQPWHIESYCEIVDPRKDKSGTTWIRLLPGESSIFVDEQSRPLDLNKIRKGEDKQMPIVFHEAKKSVSPHETLLLEYLRHCKWNEDVAAVNGHYGKVFYEWRPGEASRENAKKFREEGDLVVELRGMKTDTLKALYRIMGGGEVTAQRMDDMEFDEIRHNLRILIMRDRGQYETLKNDSLLRVKHDVYEALDRGVIRSSPANPNAFFLVSTNTLIKEAPAGSIPVSWLAQYLYEKGGETLLNIRSQLGRNILADDKLDSDVDTVIDAIIDFASNHEKGEELLAKIGKSPARMFIDDSGGEHKMGIGWDGVRKALKENPDLRANVFKRYKTLNP